MIDEPQLPLPANRRRPPRSTDRAELLHPFDIRLSRNSSVSKALRFSAWPRSNALDLSENAVPNRTIRILPANRPSHSGPEYPSTTYKAAQSTRVTGIGGNFRISIAEGHRARTIPPQMRILPN